MEYIKSQISNKLNESLLITLADHISFAIQRKEKGIEYRNPLRGPVMCYYPQEYQVGKVCLQMIEEKCKIRLNPDEATFIALHIVNAEFNTKMSQIIQRNCARHYQCALDIAAYIQNEYGKQIPEEELVYMTIHLKRLNMEED